jgi:hypothetical protein
MGSLCSFIGQTQRAVLSGPVSEDIARRHEPKSRPSPDMKSTNGLIVGFPAFRNVKIFLVFISYPVYYLS